MVEVLYHYTCAHSIKGIRRDGKLKPHRHPLLGNLELLWLTDFTEPHVEALGLTSHYIACRRTEYRITVDPAPVEVFHWPAFARELLRNGKYRAGVHSLHSADGAMPMHWWVSLFPLPMTVAEPVRSS